MKFSYLFTIIIFPFFSYAQGGLKIEPGAEVVIDNSPQIVIENGYFKNDGNFSAGSSTVHITGTTATTNSTIGGMSLTAFNHLNINKSSNDTRLDFDIDIDGNLRMNGGKLILNSSDITLDGDIIGESNSTCITGTVGGTIIKTVNLNAPTGENPGNLGAEITSTENLGNTTIYRRHMQLNNNGNFSIYRHYDIIPANNTNLDATLRMYYFDDELAGLEESDLELWQFDGVNWTSQNINSKNVANNWVEANGLSSFHTVTLAEDMSAPLPIELLDFNVQATANKKVDIYWSTAAEINNAYFDIERSKDGISFESIDQLQGHGNTNSEMHYRTVDLNPFIGINYYRLKQVDFDGSFTYSDIKSAVINSDEIISVYPNPINDVLYIQSEKFSGEGDVTINIYDALGKEVYTQKIELNDQSLSWSIHEFSEMAAGNYFMNINTALNNYSYSLVKI